MQYRFRRLVFGLTSSPAILNGTIQHHLSHYKEPEPQVSELLANSLYVDDFPGGAVIINLLFMFIKGQRPS